MRELLAVALLIAIAGSGALAEEWTHPDSAMRWTVGASRPNVTFKLWSQNRTGDSWGPFSLARVNEYSWVARVPITCKQDEYICFSATDGTEGWGLGTVGGPVSLHGEGTCSNCCHRCNGGTVTKGIGK